MNSKPKLIQNILMKHKQVGKKIELTYNKNETELTAQKLNNMLFIIIFTSKETLSMNLCESHMLSKQIK